MFSPITRLIKVKKKRRRKKKHQGRKLETHGRDFLLFLKRREWDCCAAFAQAFIRIHLLRPPISFFEVV